MKVPRNISFMNSQKVLVLIIVLVSIGAFLYFENNFITITHINVEFYKLPDAFDGYKIVHLSDLHSKEFGKGQKNLITIITKEQPDLIVFTGDLVDGRHYNIEPALKLMRWSVKIAPTYFVTGNHEWWSGEFDALEKALKENGIYVLRDTYATITKGKDQIYIIGIDDPASIQATYEEAMMTENKIIQALEGIEKSDAFKILLAHRPELFPLYSSYGFDLVLSGHAHGGQVRLPFIGGLVAPNQGLFPEYTSGEYKRGNSTMIVSRGLGNSIIPQRLFNRPEVIVLTLVKKK